MAYNRSNRFNPNTGIYSEQNEQMENELASKVAALKNISINIGDEVKKQNRMLGEMEDDTNIIQSMLSGSMKRLKVLSKGGYCKTWFQIGLFAVGTMVVMYWIIRLR